ncbi:hypothetical protein FN846DRAFT_946140 [Sphaerosporella brunnea]|uniref:EKC/KEOPS complex subunit BUD32 n=1 Tax=Sphaerosporella brunnea TaxID=1250544 RepID=A0A5J5EYY7_9PEZI|nr:hypothetical protein FN846DRAFT_946140 [Sphaerosporella brunnea]
MSPVTTRKMVRDGQAPPANDLPTSLTNPARPRRRVARAAAQDAPPPAITADDHDNPALSQSSESTGLPFSTRALRQALSGSTMSVSQSLSSVTAASTPRSFNSDALRPHAFNDTANRPRSSKTPRLVMDVTLYTELLDRVAYDVDALWDIFDDTDVDVPPAYLHDGNRWVGWPPSPYEGDVLQWFFDDICPLLPTVEHADGHRIEYVASGDLILQNGDADRKGDLLVRCCSPDSTSRSYWDQVRIVGELKRNPDKDGRDKTFIQLANYMRELFGTQPQRCWALGFTLCGALMRLFRFDRSGAVASTAIDIHKEPRTFIAATKGFLTRDAAVIGFDPTIRWNPEPDREAVYDPTLHFLLPSLPDPFIVADGKKYRIYRSFIVRRYAIATRGTVCWRARPFDSPEDSPWTYVVKDQWRAAERDVEGDFMSRIEPGTVGLPGYIWHADMRDGDRLMDVASYIRHGLAHGTQRNSTSRALTRTSYNLYHPAADIRLQNRVKTRIIMSPLGKPLLSFRSYKHLLLALRDAVLGHRHMYTQHGIVHRDVSLNNILLHPDTPGTAAGPYGFLIDFDFAIDRARQALCGADFITGTFMYMSIDVLEGSMTTPHSPIEDLESFYYVLLDIAIHYDERGARRSPLPAVTVFHRNHHGSLEELRKSAVDAKTACLKKRKFVLEVLPTCNATAQDELWELLDDWRGLIDEAHRRADDVVLIRMGRGLPITRPAIDPDRRDDQIEDMYNAVLGILERAIERLAD